MTGVMQCVKRPISVVDLGNPGHRESHQVGLERRLEPDRDMSGPCTSLHR